MPGIESVLCYQVLGCVCHCVGELGLPHFSFPKMGEGDTPYDWLYGEALPERGPFVDSGIRKGMGKCYIWYLKRSLKH